MKYFVYILMCKDNSFYTGITTDVTRRFTEHQAGKGAKYTRARGVKEVVYIEVCKNRSEASQRELEIKKLTRAQKQTLIQDWTYV